MRRIQFQVDDQLPPKKHGRKSMWNRKTEAGRLIVLREKALHKMRSQPLFTGNIRLTLNVHVGCQARVVVKAGEKGFGDLDNFVSGVCDGLMVADPKVIPDPSLWPEDSAVYPTATIAIEDDVQVAEIVAKKCIGPGAHCWYEIELKEVEGE